MDGATIEYMPHGIKHWLNESSTNKVEGTESTYRGIIPHGKALEDLLNELYDHCTYIEITVDGVDQMMVPNQEKAERLWFLHDCHEHATCSDIAREFDPDDEDCTIVDIDNVKLTVLF